MKTKTQNSSGNIFVDLKVSNPEESLAKAEIASKIHVIIKKKKLTQVKVAKKLNITQSKVSLLLRGYLIGFSLERLFRFLNALGQDVKISIAKSRSRKGKTTIGHTIITNPISKPAIAALSR